MTAFADDQPPTGYTLLRREASPRHTFRVEHYTSPEYLHQIWAASVRQPQKRRLLVAYGENDEGASYDPDILVSSNERWVARRQKTGSGVDFVAIYRRTAPLTYQLVAPEMADAAWAFLGTSLGLRPDAVPPHHRYMEALRWGSDGSLLLRLSGNNCPEYGLSDWCCAYHTDTGTFSVPGRYVQRNRRALGTCHH